MIFFTSDTHFYHKNIIGHCNRPFKSVEEMNEGLIEAWNSKVKEHDDVYLLGDFAFCGPKRAIEILLKLNGRKYWITGNHDKGLCKKETITPFFEWIKPLTRIRVKGFFGDREFDKKIVLCHFPILSWEGMGGGTWHFHGHCHGSLSDRYGGCFRMDVGVDTRNDLTPYSLLEVEEYMASQHFEKVDHHGE